MNFRYDKGNAKSRIDYYGGMVKTYQLTPKVFPEYGSSIKIAPITTEKVLNQMTCLQVNGTEDHKVEIQSVLPDMTDFKFVGKEDMMDSETSKWRMTQTIGDKINKYTMWVKYRQDLSGQNVPIPVRYEMKGYNSLLGSHYDHYYLDYMDYNVDPIDPSVFEVDAGLKCTSFPGPGAHYATFNPMKEFVHPKRDFHVDDEFTRFKVKHSKQYFNDIEHSKRLNIFRQNLRYVYSKNRAHLGYSLAINHLADRTDDELKALRGRRYSVDDNGGLPFPYGELDIAEMSVKLPPEFDWRLFGAVTPVKDQSVCGSCWSFGTTGAVEGALFLHNGGHLVRLSQQALVDCSWGFGNNGCDGGEDFRAYKWIMQHGLPTEEDYGGYLGQDGYCHIDNVTAVTSIKGWVNVTANNENALRLAIFKHGPISVGIDASHKSFSFYSHGVYFEPKCANKVDELDHAVLAVGYGALNGQKYWLIKNSWSNLWGNDGYVLMSSKENNCGVETAPTGVFSKKAYSFLKGRPRIRSYSPLRTSMGGGDYLHSNGPRARLSLINPTNLGVFGLAKNVVLLTLEQLTPRYCATVRMEPRTSYNLETHEGRIEAILRHLPVLLHPAASDCLRAGQEERKPTCEGFL
ncbi:Counting factor associated protein D [Eumeta japonica]|uniref:Counting factor associated protein D n=1 Tax=Eumeta variegata TaxID=151549 RepID=A0A4C1WEI9_EUMVA|nr:Counting factor associated protein D [Eumeta japonica]